jgi:putative transposase
MILPPPTIVGNGLTSRADQSQGVGPTQLWTFEGWLYVAVVIDAFSRRVVGWSMAAHLRTELVLNAFNMAVWARRPDEGLVHHSDHGCQYTSLAFGRRLREAGIVGSMGTVGDCFDNAACASHDRDLRLRRRLLQPASTSLDARLPQPRRL